MFSPLFFPPPFLSYFRFLFSLLNSLFSLITFTPFVNVYCALFHTSSFLYNQRSYLNESVRVLEWLNVSFPSEQLE